MKQKHAVTNLPNAQSYPKSTVSLQTTSQALPALWDASLNKAHLPIFRPPLTRSWPCGYTCWSRLVGQLLSWFGSCCLCRLLGRLGSLLDRLLAGLWLAAFGLQGLGCSLFSAGSINSLIVGRKLGASPNLWLE